MDARLPWPADVPLPTLPPLVVETHGSGIALFGDAVVQALQFNAESDDHGVAPLPEEFKVPAAACGGADKWHQHVAACVRAVHGQPGGLLFNWFTLNPAEGGANGVRCLTCGGKPLSFGGGRDSSSPFTNFITGHLRSPKHTKARDAVIAQVEAAVAAGSSKTRAEIAMDILASRAGILPSSPLPSVQLRPVGSEPIGLPMTRSFAWSSEGPGQPATKQEQLDSKLGVGAYRLNDDSSLAACQRCSRHRPTWIQLSHPNWLKNAIAHFEKHGRPKNGMQPLEFFGIRATSERLCDAVPARGWMLPCS